MHSSAHSGENPLTSPEGDQTTTAAALVINLEKNELLTQPENIADHLLMRGDAKMDADGKVPDSDNTLDFEPSTADEESVRAPEDDLDAINAIGRGEMDELRAGICAMALTRIQKSGAGAEEERLMDLANAGKWRLNDEYGTIHCGGAHTGNDPARDNDDACAFCAEYYSHIGRDVLSNDESLNAILALRNLRLAAEEYLDMESLQKEITDLKAEVDIANSSKEKAEAEVLLQEQRSTEEGAHFGRLKNRLDTALTENNDLKNEVAKLKDEFERANERPRKRPSVASSISHHENDGNSDTVMRDATTEDEYRTKIVAWGCSQAVLDQYKRNGMMPPEQASTLLPQLVTGRAQTDLDDIYFEAPPPVPADYAVDKYGLPTTVTTWKYTHELQRTRPIYVYALRHLYLNVYSRNLRPEERSEIQQLSVDEFVLTDWLSNVLWATNKKASYPQLRPSELRQHWEVTKRSMIGHRPLNFARYIQYREEKIQGAPFLDDAYTLNMRHVRGACLYEVIGAERLHHPTPERITKRGEIEKAILKLVAIPGKYEQLVVLNNWTIDPKFSTRTWSVNDTEEISVERAARRFARYGVPLSMVDDAHAWAMTYLREIADRPESGGEVPELAPERTRLVN
ncbi:hypothetical protein C8R43DRAFT_1128371 [Mycena crocata]|nr:hypothetical protein C8R43DRAFT_1128371 [Mycena crocata]